MANINYAITYSGLNTERIVIKHLTIETPTINFLITSRVGYTFIGWFDSEMAETKFNNTVGSIGSKTFSKMGSKCLYHHLCKC